MQLPLYVKQLRQDEAQAEEDDDDQDEEGSKAALVRFGDSPESGALKPLKNNLLPFLFLFLLLPPLPLQLPSTSPAEAPKPLKNHRNAKKSN